MSKPEAEITVHTNSAARSELLAPFQPFVEVKPRNTNGDRLPPFEESKYDASYYLMRDASRKVPLHGPHTDVAFATSVFLVNSDGRPVDILPGVGSPGDLAENLIEHLIEVGSDSPFVLFGSAISANKPEGFVTLPSFVQAPLRSDLNREIVAESLAANPELNGEVGWFFQTQQRELLNLSGLRDDPRVARLMQVAAGIDPSLWYRMLENLFPRTLVSADALWAIPHGEVTSSIMGFNTLVDRLMRWRDERPLFSTTKELTEYRLARIDVGKMLEEAGELAMVFNEVSAANSFGIQVPLAYSAEVHKNIKKELADVFIFMLNAVGQSGNDMTRLWLRVVGDQGEASMIDSFPEVKKELSGLHAEQIIMQLSYMANRSFNNMDSWQPDLQADTLDYLAMILEVSARYSLAMGWDLRQLIIDAINTNIYNYPKELADNEIGPVRSREDVFALCRHMRHSKTNPESGWTMLDDYHHYILEKVARGVIHDLEPRLEKMSDREKRELIRPWIREQLEFQAKNTDLKKQSLEAQQLLERLDFSVIKWRFSVGKLHLEHTDQGSWAFSVDESA